MKPLTTFVGFFLALIGVVLTHVALTYMVSVIYVGPIPLPNLLYLYRLPTLVLSLIAIVVGAGLVTSGIMSE